jgi:hypothetical protein
LNTLLSYLHPILQRQQLDYRIFVAEQVRFYLNGLHFVLIKTNHFNILF